MNIGLTTWYTHRRTQLQPLRRHLVISIVSNIISDNKCSHIDNSSWFRVTWLHLPDECYPNVKCSLCSSHITSCVYGYCSLQNARWSHCGWGCRRSRISPLAVTWSLLLPSLKRGYARADRFSIFSENQMMLEYLRLGEIKISPLHRLRLKTWKLRCL